MKFLQKYEFSFEIPRENSNFCNYFMIFYKWNMARKQPKSSGLDIEDMMNDIDNLIVEITLWIVITFGK